jgi:hypothetical protein
MLINLMAYATTVKKIKTTLQCSITVHVLPAQVLLIVVSSHMSYRTLIKATHTATRPHHMQAAG